MTTVVVILLTVVAFAIGVPILIKDRNAHRSSGGSTDGSNASETSDVLVVYYSAQGHTAAVAEQVAENLGADIFEIIPTDTYTMDDLDWSDENSRVSLEHDDYDWSLQKIELDNPHVPNWRNYSVVLIGYPLWWGEAAHPVAAFVANNNFSGKTVIPFCTSASSVLGQSGELLARLARSGNWQVGQRFDSDATEEEIKEWTDSL